MQLHTIFSLCYFDKILQSFGQNTIFSSQNISFFTLKISLTFFETATGLTKKRQNAARLCRTIVSIVIDQSERSILPPLAAEARAVIY